MKKPVTICLAVIAVVAIIVSCVFGSQKGSLQKQLADVTAAAEGTKTDLEKQLADAAAAAESAKADLEKQAADAAAAAETVKADLEKQLADAATAAEAAKTDLEKQLADARTAADAAKADLEKQLADARTAADAAKADLEKQTAALKTADTAKADLEKQLAAAKADLEKQAADAAAAAESAKADLEKQLADAGAAAETVKADLEKQLADAKAEAEAAKAELEKQVAAVTVADAAKAELEQKLADADAAAEAAKTDLEKQLADALEAAETLKTDLEARLAKAERAKVAAGANAYIMYANADWSASNWGVDDHDDQSVLVNPAKVEGPGSYTTSLEFATPAEGLAFAAVGLVNGEKLYPGCTIDIKEIRINGEKIEIGKGYTSSDDGRETRENIYNEWVSALPADARRADQDLTDASPIIVSKDAFSSVSKIEVDFDFWPLTAYLMFANSDWSIQNWGVAEQEGVTVVSSTVDGEGEYSVGLNFDQPSEGLAFAAIGIKNGEKTFPGYIIQATSVTVNGGEENLLTGIGYTNADDGQETRENLYNEWVDAANLPADARNAEGMENAAPIIINRDAFTGVTSVNVNFKFIKGQAVAAAAEASMTEEEAKTLKDAGFNAYIAVQGKDTYVFRNSWNDTYGLTDEEHPYFHRLTGWDESNNAVDYGGSFTDTAIKGDGEYTVSLTTGEMGFGTTAAFNLLFVSTDIPSKLVKDGWLTISDVKTKIGDGATQDYTQVDTEGDYVRLVVLDSYNQSAEPFGYTVPGANATISITFTVSGW